MKKSLKFLTASIFLAQAFSTPAYCTFKDEAIQGQKTALEGGDFGNGPLTCELPTPGSSQEEYEKCKRLQAEQKQYLRGQDN